MNIINHRITIISIGRPRVRNINDELQWFGHTLGLFNLRDKDKSCFRLFIELVKNARRNHPSTSDELAAKLQLTRGTVIHHLNKLMESGLVVHQKNQYVLRVDSLRDLVDEVEKDIRRSLEDLRSGAAEIDQWLGL